MDKHTPGPWSLNERGQIVSTEGVVIEESYYANEADLSLMACAPELFEALESILSFDLETDGATEYWSTLLVAVASGRAAINKARGNHDNQGEVSPAKPIELKETE